MQAARVGGALAIAVLTGPATVWPLAMAGADAFLDDLTEFPKWLSTYLSGFTRSRPGC
jgi:phosphoglycolate phosphatase